MRVQGAGQNCRLTTEVSEFTQRNAGSLEILLSGIQIPGKKGHPLLLRFSFSHSQTTRTAIQRPTRNNVNKWRVTMQTLDLARKWTVRFQIKDRLLYAKLLYNESSSAASLVIQVTCKDAPLTLLQQATTSKRLFFFFPQQVLSFCSTTAMCAFKKYADSVEGNKWLSGMQNNSISIFEKLLQKPRVSVSFSPHQEIDDIVGFGNFWSGDTWGSKMYHVTRAHSYCGMPSRKWWLWKNGVRQNTWCPLSLSP